MGQHAVLSASGAHRWLECTPSARLEEGFEDRPSSSAKEGTLAHEIAEAKLRNAFIEPLPKRSFNSALKAFTKREEYQKEMDTLTDEYIGYIKELVLSAPTKPVVRAEVKVDFSKYVPEGFGTADCIIIRGNTLHIVDFKYGRNVAVHPEDNPQLKLYALGAIEGFGMFFDIKIVRMHIFQPRNTEGGGVFSMDAEDLKAWGESIKPLVDLAYMGAGEQKAGSWCGFCKARPICEKHAEKCRELAALDFKKPELLTHEEIGRILQQAKDVASWAKALEEYALSEVLKGEDIPGWKAVEGRTSRAWSDMDSAFKKLTDSGISEEILWTKSPLTLAQVEKEIGKKDFTALVGDMVVTSAGKPTLVPENDKRTALKIKAADEFKEDLTNE
jgi:phage protein|uniref:PD-(D/E)XK nuclease superfamily protein n=1 Tax=Siphoviridae sp. ctFiA6 TaxID=2823573 RepID=A0A8S5LGF8_9CAUD|nr:MAG TPA: PD-(D/E)XK nuclease superfamily protein [Siphoviridae sp. ctFiA6]